MVKIEIIEEVAGMAKGTVKIVVPSIAKDMIEKGFAKEVKSKIVKK